MSASPFEFAIDVDGDGDYDDAIEDISAYVMGASNVTCSRGKDAAKSFAAPAAGSYNAELINFDKRFSPGNPSSPYFGQRLTGKRVRWLSTGAGAVGGNLGLQGGGGGLELEGGGDLQLEGDASKQVVWTGRLLRFLHHAEKEKLTVEMPSLSMLSRLVGKNVSTAVYQDIKTSDAIGVILDATGWPFSERIISMGQTVLSWWWWDGDAFQAIVALLLSEGPGASIYDTSAGYFVFEDREYRNTQSRCTSSQATYTDMDAKVQPPFDYDENEQNIIEACGITVEELEAQAIGPLWSLGTDLTLGPGEVWKQRFRPPSAFINALVPDPTLSNTIWKFEGDQTLLSGTFKIRYNGQLTGPIPWNASGTTIAAALQGLSTIGINNAAGSGASLATGSVFVELIGPFAGVNITDLPEIVESTLNPVAIPGGIDVVETFPGGAPFYERQRLTPVGVLVAGTFTITVTWSTGSGTTGSLSFDATATEIAEAIADDIFGLSNTTAHGGPIHTSPVDLNLVDLTENIDSVEIIGSGLMMNTPSATVNVSQSQPGGVADYVLSSGSITWTLDRTSGTSALLTGTAGVDGAALTGPRVRGQLISVARTHEELYPADVEDRILAGEDIKIYRPDVLSGVSRATAAFIAQLYVSYYFAPRPTINLTIVTSIYSSAMSVVLGTEVSDRITAEIEHLGLSADFFVEQISQSLVGTKLITTLGCEMVM